MFCPKGYVPVSAIMAKISDQAVSTIIDDFKQYYDQPIDNRNAEKEVHRRISVIYNKTPLDIIESYIFRNSNGSLYISNTKGEVLRFDGMSLIRQMNTVTVSKIFNIFNSHRRDGRAFYREARNALNLNAFESESIIKRIMQATPDDEIHCIDRMNNYGIFRRHSFVPLFYERACYTLNFDVFDKLMNTIECTESTSMKRIFDRSHFAINIARPFNGSSLCVDADFYHGPWKDLISRLEENSPGRVIEEEIKPIGRPSTQRKQVTEAYRLIYPNGHDGASWKEVQRELERRAGVGASIDTIKRAILDLNADDPAD